jgi:hypothetical protein
MILSTGDLLWFWKNYPHKKHREGLALLYSCTYGFFIAIFFALNLHLHAFQTEQKSLFVQK